MLGMIETVENPVVATPSTVTDAELLAGYATNASASEAMFSQIVDRHSRMVYSTCFRILGETHAAEDAAQATFLVLTRRAASLPRQTVLSGWLYITAQNTAYALKRSAQRRARHEREVVNMTNIPADEAWEDVRDKLDSALATLPGVQRDALVLRYMNGLSETDSAREMGCSERTLHTRVTRALAKLRDKLRRRGTGVSLSVLAVLLSSRINEVPPATLSVTIKAACLGKAAAAPAALAAANATLAAIAWAQMKMWAMLVFALTVAGSLAFVAVTNLHSKPRASSPSPAVISVGAPATTEIPQKSAAREAQKPAALIENNDGRHLEDRTIWKTMGALKLDATPTEARIELANGDPELWSAGGLLNHTAWDLSKYTVSIKVTSDTSADCETNFFGLCYFLIDGGELDDPAALDRAIKEGGKFTTGQYVGVKRAATFATRVSELVLSNTEAVLTIDGRTQHIPFARPSGGAFIGFRAGARNTRDAQVFSVRDVVITKKEIAAPAEKF